MTAQGHGEKNSLGAYLVSITPISGISGCSEPAGARKQRPSSHPMPPGHQAYRHPRLVGRKRSVMGTLFCQAWSWIQAC